MKLTIALVLSLTAAQAHASWCSIPQTPISGDQFGWNMYYQDVEDYNRCIQNELEDLQRQQQNQQIQNQNSTLFKW